MRLTSKGQVTIPHRLRKRYGLKPESEVIVEESAEGVLIKPTATGRIDQLKKAFHQSRGSAEVKSTEELMRLTRGED